MPINLRIPLATRLSNAVSFQLFPSAHCISKLIRFHSIVYSILALFICVQLKQSTATLQLTNWVSVTIFGLEIEINNKIGSHEVFTNIRASLPKVYSDINSISLQTEFYTSEISQKLASEIVKSLGVVWNVQFVHWIKEKSGFKRIILMIIFILWSEVV